MGAESTRLAGFLREPERLSQLGLSDWDCLLPVARRAGLVARLACLLSDIDGLGTVPAAVRVHLESARLLSEKHARDVRFEVDRLAALLAGLNGRFVLLKGSAYVVAALPPARGRLFNDIDIMVPREALPSLESMFGLAGWRMGEIDPYDEQYYRKWMHQLPPMIHGTRNIALDVHHTIVPSTSGIGLSGEQLLEDAIPVAGIPGAAVLSPPDMVLHSTVHLFNEGEFERGLRDLEDLNVMIRHFMSTDPDFWTRLIVRAQALDLVRPLFFALRYTRRILGTPVPGELFTGADVPRGPRLVVMDGLFHQALRSPHPSCRSAATGLALWVLYVRAHYLRMPLHLLLPHLARKMMRRLSGSSV